MTKDELFGKIKEILLAEFELAENAVTPTARLWEDLDLDSVDAVDLIVRIKTLIPDAVITAEMFKQTRTVQDVVDALHPLVNK